MKVQRKQRVIKESNEKKGKLPSYLPIITIDDPEDIPSKGIMYKEGWSISYVPYTFGEVKALSSSTLNDSNAFDAILKGVECNFPVEELTVSDLMFIGFLRKISSLGETKYIYKHLCECGDETMVNFTHEEIDFKNLDIPSLPKVDFNVIDNNGNEKVLTVEFKPMNVGDFLSLMQRGKIDDTEYLLAAHINNLKEEQAIDFISKIHKADDFEVIKDVRNLLEHKLNPLKCKCKTCGSEAEVNMEGMSANRLLPFRRDSESPKSRIKFSS